MDRDPRGFLPIVASMVLIAGASSFPSAAGSDTDVTLFSFNGNATIEETDDTYTDYFYCGYSCPGGWCCYYPYQIDAFDCDASPVPATVSGRVLPVIGHTFTGQLSSGHTFGDDWPNAPTGYASAKCWPRFVDDGDGSPGTYTLSFKDYRTTEFSLNCDATHHELTIRMQATVDIREPGSSYFYPEGTVTIVFDGTTGSCQPNPCANPVPALDPGDLCNKPPTACFQPNVNYLFVAIDASCSHDPDHDPLTYDVDWGDGSPHASDPGASHAYSCIGDRTITLTVDDGQGGVATASQVVGITDDDQDGDGLVDCLENLVYGTSPSDPDSDDDLLMDGPELDLWNGLAAGAWNTNYDRFGPPAATNNLLKKDADGDGIGDLAEFRKWSNLFGNCASIGGKNECPDARIRDVYVQLNWMEGEDCFLGFFCSHVSDRPSDAEIQHVVANFATWSAHKEEKDQIRLHVYVGAAGDGNGAVPYTDEIRFNERPGDWNDLYDYKHAYFLKRGTFHFALFAHHEDGSLANPESAGRGEPMGDDLVVFHANTGTPDKVVHTWMHELGHNLLGTHHTICQGRWNDNVRASHLTAVDSSAPEYDEGRNSDGTCGSFDQVQDIFTHATDDGDAMRSGGPALTYASASWEALAPGQDLRAVQQNLDED